MNSKAEIKLLLEELGLNKVETLVYLKALELGSGTASSIAETAKLNRITAYEALKRLSRKGLIQIRVKRNSSVKHFFPAEYPDIIDKLRDREESLQNTIARAESLRNELQSHFSLSQAKPHVFFFEGYEGIKKIMNDTLHEKPEEILTFTSVESLESGLDDKFLTRYWKRRVALGIPTRGILPDTDKAVKEFPLERNKKELRRLRFISPNLYDFNNEIDVYGNNVAIISFTKGHEHGVIIRSKDIAKSMKALFEALWHASASSLTE